uniref:Major sperm protein n=1 Tax=Setaria digitata TaxID=48799 RepID=A0A915PT01_9BILA
MENRLVGRMVTFSAPLTERQAVDLDIKNDWNKAIIFKMKTTRPDAFKMKPVYGLIEPGDKKKVILTLKKWDPNKKPKKNDHFTVVMAAAPEKCNNPVKTWKSWKESKKSEASIGACRRQVKITYRGVAVKEGKKKSLKSGSAKVPAPKAEQDGGKEEDQQHGSFTKLFPADGKMEEKREDQDEKKPKKTGKSKREEDEEEEEEEDEKPRKKLKKGKENEEEGKAKKEGDGDSEEEDEDDEEDEEE